MNNKTPKAKPSGSHWRKERKAREAREAQEAHDSGRSQSAPQGRGLSGIHLRLLEAIDIELSKLYEQPIAHSERQRRLEGLCAAAGKIQIKADLERRLGELEDLVRELEQARIPPQDPAT